jgi:hypothetical protein
MKTVIKIVVGVSAIALTGCSMFVKVPSTTIKVNAKDGSIAFTSPKDGVISNLNITVSTNGTFTATVGSWNYLLNPTNIVDSANGQVAIINASGNAIANGINAAASAVGAAAGAAAKTAVKP